MGIMNEDYLVLTICGTSFEPNTVYVHMPALFAAVISETNDHEIKRGLPSSIQDRGNSKYVI
jgi:hypothetical protein